MRSDGGPGAVLQSNPLDIRTYRKAFTNVTKDNPQGRHRHLAVRWTAGGGNCRMLGNKHRSRATQPHNLVVGKRSAHERRYDGEDR